MTLDWRRHSWPFERVGLAVEALAARAGMRQGDSEGPSPPQSLDSEDHEALDAWLETLASHLGFELEPRAAPYPRAVELLRESAPAIVSFPTEEGRRFLAMTSVGRRRATVLTPELRTVRLSLEDVRHAACRHLEEPADEWNGELLDECELRGARRRRARRALLRSRLAGEMVTGVYALHAGLEASFWRALRRAGVPLRLGALAASHAAGFALWLVSWWMIGRGALDGRIESGWLIAWGLLLLTMLPFQMLQGWFSALLSITVGGLVKQRLLAGALRLDAERIRREGSGALYGRVMESEAIDALALGAGISGLLAFVELIAAGAVLSLGPGGALHCVLLALWVVLTLLVSLRYYARLRDWTRARVSMTSGLVEKIVGQRTRLAQGRPNAWHEGEDRDLESYLSLSGALDRCALRASWITEGWYVVGLLGLAPALTTGDATPAALAVGIGGVLLARSALSRVEEGVDEVGEALIAWKQVAPMFRAAALPEVRPSRAALALGDRVGATSKGAPVVEAHRVSYRYGARREPVLHGVDLRVERGDRLLVQGPSGSGKSTLASILAGVRAPLSGVVLAGGLDWLSLGPRGWHRRIAEAPQFQDNHVFADTLAFNLLMARRWPPTSADLELAETICQELGLGELLEHMPGRLQQVVGEGGWPLSHGERSRVFIARALLQSPETLILDESFAALDAQSLRQALTSVMGRSRTLVLIAHP